MTFSAQKTCSFRAIFGLSVRNLTIATGTERAMTCIEVRKKYIGALKYYSGLFFEICQIVRTNVSADF